MDKTARAVVAMVLGTLLIFVVFWYFGSKTEQHWTTTNSLYRLTHFDVNDDLDPKSLLRAVEHSLHYLDKLPEETAFSFGPEQITKSRMVSSLLDLGSKVEQLGVSPELFSYISSNYEAFSSKADRVLFTGYYEASLNGSLTETEAYTYPIYKAPPDLVTVNLSNFPISIKYPDLPRTITGRISGANLVAPYYDRSEIDFGGKLAGKNLELFWVNDPVEAFFLHIQGSGKILLQDGSERQISFAASNGQPYRPIGRKLKEEGKLAPEDVSMQSIKRFLAAHPETNQEIFSYNPSYIFFREVADGPIGSIGVSLTPLRSIATDDSIFPKGAIALITSEQPVFDQAGTIVSWKKFQRIVLNQDTGGAIKGAGRVDLFTGSGRDREAIAGAMKQPGELLFLLKRG